MHDVLLWFLWLEVQLEKPDANPAETHREHRAAFALASMVCQAAKRRAFDGRKWASGTKQKIAFENVIDALAYFNSAKLNVKSSAKALGLVSEAVSALQDAGYEIPF